jgi:fructose-specific phosphotransferase system component IIB|tara:strand:- start:199 stop:444 length:246 start_codon:yes stop_codon:yes gene_type:complete
MKKPSATKQKKKPTIKQLAADVENMWNGLMYLDTNIKASQRYFEEYLIMKGEVEEFITHFEQKIEEAKNEKEKEPEERKEG